MKIITLSTLLLTPFAMADNPELEIPEDALIIYGKAESLLGEASTATQGQASNEELSKRPVLRRGELLEVIPGVIISSTQAEGRQTNITSEAII